jgi:aarF domain-containing kinase
VSLKASPLLRTLELAKLVTQVGLKEFKSGDFKSRMEQATLIAGSLSQMKGAAMKAGQLLSLDLDNYFPPEAIEILSQLQSAAVAHPSEEMIDILKKEIPKEGFSRLKNISRHPIGVASIGQVHRAQFDAKEIVLKVQYPKVADSIDSDLRILKTIAISFCTLSGRRMNLDPLFKEFRQILEQEVDYQSEAQFQKDYQKKIAKIQGRALVRYRVPSVIDEISNKKVLAMNFETGLSLRSWVLSQPQKEHKVHLAQSILGLYFHEFFEWGLVQTDPNWGNFLVESKKDQVDLVLLDFGATKKYNRLFIRNYMQLLNLAAEKNWKKIKEHAIEFGLIDPRESDEAFAAFEVMLSTAIKPFFINKQNQGYFDFADRDHILDSQVAAKNLAKKLIYSPPPYSLIFLHRKLAGVYSVLKHLEVQLDITPYWEKMRTLSEGSA